MAADERQSDVKELLQQLERARSEIKNLRSQIISLKFSFRKDADDIQQQINNGLEPRVPEIVGLPESCGCEFSAWRSIGVVKTWFPGKRGVPRQACLSPEAQGVITLSPVVINNPAFSLLGLEEFSHVWILFHFHQTSGTHIKTKVAPPRLGGARVGVFGTRSPHRPCPIGLSLVKLDRIEGNTIHFSGVDMVDGTPVLDIKPYIPQYDDPRCLLNRSDVVEQRCVEDDVSEVADDDISRHVEGKAESETPPSTSVSGAINQSDESLMGNSGSDVPTLQLMENRLDSMREAPDGEEGPVQVASWITSPPSRILKVSYSERASAQLAAFTEHGALRATVTRLLEQDPRSNYLRRKLGSQFYTFRIDALYVSVKFDDVAGSVTVTSVQQALE